MQCFPNQVKPLKHLSLIGQFRWPVRFQLYNANAFAKQQFDFFTIARGQSQVVEIVPETIEMLREFRRPSFAKTNFSELLVCKNQLGSVVREFFD